MMTLSNMVDYMTCLLSNYKHKYIHVSILIVCGGYGTLRQLSTCANGKTFTPLTAWEQG